MAVQSCWILAGTGTCCRIYADPEYPKHAQWVTCPVSMLAMQELGCFQLPGTCNMGLYIIMLQHEMMVVDEWHNIGPQDLVTVSLCIQNAINKMHMCSLSITHACLFHNPTAPMGHSIHNVDISSPTQRHTRCLPSALYSENRDSSVKRTLFQSARRHRMLAFAHSSRLRRRRSSGRDPDEEDEHANELPWDGFWQFVHKFSYANRLLQQLSGWLVSDDFGGEDPGCGRPGLVWLHVVCGCEARWMYCQNLWNVFGDGLW